MYKVKQVVCSIDADWKLPAVRDTTTRDRFLYELFLDMYKIDNTKGGVFPRVCGLLLNIKIYYQD